MRLWGLGGRLSRQGDVHFRVRVLFGLLGSSRFLLLPMGHCYGMRGIQNMPLNPKHLLFCWVFHPDSPPSPKQHKSQPRGRHHRCRAPKPMHQAGGQVRHPPPKRRVPHATFAIAASSSPPFPFHGGLRGPSTTSSLTRRTCACHRCPFCVSSVGGGGGGQGRGFRFFGWGGVCWGGRCGGLGVSTDNSAARYPHQHSPPTPTHSD